MREKYYPRDEIRRDVETFVKGDLMFRERGWDNSKMGDSAEFTSRDYLGEENGAELERLLSTKKDPCVIELGSGKGKTLAGLKSKYGHILDVGVDLISGSEKQGIREVVSDLENLAIKEESADVIYSVQTYRYIPDKLKLLEEIYRILKPDGVAYIHLGESPEGFTNPSLIDFIVRAGMQEHFRLQEVELKKEESNVRTEYVLRIQKPQESKPLNWRSVFRGSVDPEESEKYSLGTVESLYELDTAKTHSNTF